MTADETAGHIARHGHDEITPTEARLALDAVEHRRQQVVDEIDMPRWYWWGLAVGWAALGLVVEVGNVVATSVATLVFGAVHAAVAQRVLSGRHRTSALSVRSDLVDRHIPALVIGYLLVLGALNVALGFLFAADGAEHPSAIAGLVVGLLVGLGGPSLMAWARRRSRSRTS
jgi:hypothetical protein